MFYDFKLLDLFFVIFWFCLFLFSLILELQLKQLSLINFSLSALITATLGATFADIPQQLIIFIILSIFIRILFQPVYKKNKIRRIFLNQVCTFIGRQAVVSKTISPNNVGELNISNIKWEAVCAGDYILEVGEIVLISGKSGINLVASKFKNKQNTSAIS